MYKANWSDKKFVHITSKRFVDRVEEEITVKVYSNCGKVTLYVNGCEFDTKLNDNKILIFENVKLQDGVNEIKVISNEDGIVLKDIAKFNKVSEENLSYVLPADETGGVVENWFDVPDMSDVEVEELEITDDVYSTRCTFNELLANEETKSVMIKYLGNITDDPMFEMAKTMKVDLIVSMAPHMFNKKLVYSINKELIKIKK